mgnify:CR=1 FL=1|jgi:hypothetical protein
MKQHYGYAVVIGIATLSVLTYYYSKVGQSKELSPDTAAKTVPEATAKTVPEDEDVTDQ